MEPLQSFWHIFFSKVGLFSFTRRKNSPFLQVTLQPAEALSGGLFWEWVGFPKPFLSSAPSFHTRWWVLSFLRSNSNIHKALKWNHLKWWYLFGRKFYSRSLRLAMYTWYSGQSTNVTMDLHQVWSSIKVEAQFSPFQKKKLEKGHGASTAFPTKPKNGSCKSEKKTCS